MQATKKRVRPNKLLFAEGETGIITKFKAQVQTKRFKQLIRTNRDNDEVFDLICQLDDLEKLIQSQRLLNRVQLEKKYLKPLKGRIYYAIVRQGFISRKSLKRFKYKVQKLVIAIEYRKLIEVWIKKNICDFDNEVIRKYLGDEADKGQFIDTYLLSNEYYELSEQIRDAKQFIDDDLSKSVTDENWLKLAEIRNRDQVILYNRRSKIENLCYHIHHNPPDTINHNIKAFDSRKLLSLGTSSLEKIISFYCQKMNEYNASEIQVHQKDIKETHRKARYQKKKDYTASEKRALVQLCKAQDMNQAETVKFSGFKRTTVQTYWH